MEADGLLTAADGSLWRGQKPRGRGAGSAVLGVTGRERAGGASRRPRGADFQSRAAGGRRPQSSNRMSPAGRARDAKSEGGEIRTPKILIWSQTRCRCANPPMTLDTMLFSPRQSLKAGLPQRGIFASSRSCHVFAAHLPHSWSWTPERRK